MRSKRGSYSSPRGSRRACLCKDGATYSRKCCDGELINQGIGSISGLILNTENVTYTGLSISALGAVTAPTATYKGVDLGTVTVNPTSFSTVGTPTDRTVESTVTVPESIEVSGEQVRFGNAGATVTKSETVTQPSSVFSCSDVGATNLFISPTGGYTLSITNGTVSGTSPANFSSNATLADISRTVTATIVAPAGYTNEGETITCDITGYQPSFTKVYNTNNLTGTRTWRLKIKGDNVPDTSAQTIDIVAKGGIQYFGYAEPTVVSGDSSGITISSSGAIYYISSFGSSTSFLTHKSDSPFTEVQTGPSNVNITATVNVLQDNGSTVSVISSDTVGFNVYVINADQQSGAIVFIQQNDTQGFNTASNMLIAVDDGYYTQTSLNAQIRVQSGVITEYSTIT